MKFGVKNWNPNFIPQTSDVQYLYDWLKYIFAVHAIPSTFTTFFDQINIFIRSYGTKLKIDEKIENENELHSLLTRTDEFFCS